MTVERIVEQLVAEAVWDDDRAVWLGDEVEPDARGGRAVVYHAVGGDLYGGTAGIGLFLARAAADERTARAAAGATRHALAWVERTRPDGALLSGAGGVALAALEVADRLDDPELRARAVRVARVAVARPPVAADLVSGLAGHLLALLRLEQLGLDLPAEAAADVAAERLMATAGPGPVVGVAWSSDIGGEAPLCGLAHGASGPALALAEWGARRRRAEPLAVAREAVAYERAWFSAREGSWADLRGLDERAVRDGSTPGYPHLWCHGSLGIGVARLRLYEVTGDEVYAAEAGVAVDAAVGVLESMGSGPADDLSTCHGVAGAVELLLDASRTFGQPVLAEMAREGAAAAVELVGDDPWPCGVPDGGENPSLFVGLAGIGTMLLRLDHPEVPSTVRAYAGRTMSDRVIVKLAGPLDAAEVSQRVASVTAAVPGARVDRVSPSGRVLLRLPVDADPAAAVATLGALAGVEYAEQDVVDSHQGTDSPAV
ncbi:MAG: lanthionine synthetase LanC family protein [Cellulomonas sp.]